MNRYHYPPTPACRVSVGAVAISKGGTGAVTIPDAVSGLGGVYSLSLDQAGYVAKLMSDGLVNPAQLPDSVVRGSTINGPDNLYPTQVVSYTITNYDSLSSYAITVSAGSCILNNDTIKFTAPSTAQVVTLTINGRAVPITVKEPWPLKPTLAASTSGSNAQAVGTMTGSVFQMVVGSLTHLSTDWQVSTNNTFTNIVVSSIGDTTNKTNWDAIGLSLSTTYYTRCRYTAANGVSSDWSDIVTFSTKSRYSPTTEEAKIQASDKAANNDFAWSLDVDDTGTRVVVGAYLSSQQSLLGSFGVVYVYKRTGTAWAQETKIDVSGLLAAGIHFGYSVSINSDGTRIALGAPLASNGLTSQCGAVYIYLRTGTTWAQETILYASDRAANDNFGSAVAINSDGSRVVIGAPAADPSSTTGAGAAYVFLRTGTTWTQEAKLIASDKAASDAFGNSVCICDDASRVIVGSYLADPSAIANAGAVYVFLRTTTTWAQEQKLIASDKLANDQFGFSVATNSDATRVVIGANLVDPSSIANAGAAYIFFRNTVTWTQESKIVAFDKTANDQFGQSVAMNGDGNKLVVGSMLADKSGAANCGAAYIFNRIGTIWAQETKLLSSDGGADDDFGCCVALAADSSRLAIGAYLEDPGGTSNAGSGYIFA